MANVALNSNATADRSGEQMVPRLLQQACDVRRIAAGLDEAALQRRPLPSQWSIHELVCHIWRVQQLFDARIDVMLEQEEPRFESYSHENDPQFETMVASSRALETVSAFMAERDRFAGRLEGLRPTDWRRKGQHPTFGTFDVEFLIEYMVYHEAHHVYQMFIRRIPVAKLRPIPA